ncbi:MAG: WecB/TagA/CpsF family glycosyltransferase [Oscillibacter sp.]|nr:WecB/TagA/CpsF family glycosyltransferase [Oscillibacter sp.]
MRINVLGVGFDNLLMIEAVARGVDMLSQPGAHYVVTPNPEIVEICRKNPEAMRAVNGADLVLADGIGIIKGAWILGTPLKARNPGIEFAAYLMREMAEKGRSLYLLGAKPGVAEAAGERLAAKYPGLRIAGTHDGYFQEDGPVIEAIRRSGADCVFVCLGAPKQELWMAKHGEATGARLLCGLGGSLDVFAGVVERAPKFWSDHGLEWFYRLCKDPRRAGRMMKLPLFLVHVRKEKRRKCGES